LEFHLLAPRGVRLAAVWSVEDNRLRCYGADGARWQTIDLAGPDLAEFLGDAPRPAPVRSMWSAK
jgi:hypothetical protein